MSSFLDLTDPGAEWKAFNFPDGQPHITVGGGPNYSEIWARVASSDDLMRLLMVHELVYGAPSLRLAYVMGGRMDRAMPDDGWHRQPFTLAMICDVIRSVPWLSIDVLDPHSEVTPALLRAQTKLPTQLVLRALESCPPETAFVAPDAGAAKRVQKMADGIGATVVQCLKQRDETTGKLSKFTVHAAVPRHVLIVDDICDGGRTFTGLAAELRKCGARTVNLFATHGIFSAGYDIDGINEIFTTNSHHDIEDPPDHLTVYDWAGAWL